MPTRHAVLAAWLMLITPAVGIAEEPLSAIDWLNQNPPSYLPGAVLVEPPVSRTALRPAVTVSPLAPASRAIGLVPPNVTGLPEDLWLGSPVRTLARLISTVPVLDSPALQTLLYTLLLAETAQPAASADAETLLLARVARLMELGAVEPAQALLEQAGPAKSPTRFSRWFDATLLTGDEERSCAALNTASHLAPDYAARLFCAVRGGDVGAATVLLDSIQALGLMPAPQIALLDRFLNPDLYDGAEPLAPPPSPSPLTFRLYESIGEPLPTGSLPRAFSNADLRDLAGWKAQVEAAERLARTGALSPNQLLGIYTARLPAASGGVWDRVAALQRFETALGTASSGALVKTLPPVWRAMQQVQLEVPFSTLFGETLTAQSLPDPQVADLAFRIGLLSPAYESAASSAPDTKEAAYLAALARGEPDAALDPSPLTEAIADAFGPDQTLSAPLQTALDQDRLGELILRAMALFYSGAQGNLNDLTKALVAFRAVGLEDTARRAALQLMLLDRP